MIDGDSPGDHGPASSARQPGLDSAPRLDRSAARNIALGCTLATMAFSLILLFFFRTGVLTPQFAFGPEGGPYGLRWLPGPTSASRLAWTA